MKYLNENFSLSELNFLKRIYKDEINYHCSIVLIGRFVEKIILDNHEEIDDVLNVLKINFGIDDNDVIVVLVPQYPAFTEKQRDEWSRVWPLIPSHFEMSTPLPSLFTVDDINRMRYFMSLAIEEALISKSNGNFPIGCVITNESGDILVKSQDSRNTHILDHCVMNVINSISKMQIEKEDKNNYLCTNLHLYITREPCIMCSMALLHSRISRVVYGSENLESGGLGSKFKIHCSKKLNHKFHVYKGLMKEQCSDLWKDYQYIGNNDNTSGFRFGNYDNTSDFRLGNNNEWY